MIPVIDYGSDLLLRELSGFEQRIRAARCNHDIVKWHDLLAVVGLADRHLTFNNIGSISNL